MFNAGDKGALARGIRQGYDVLYQTYENAHERSPVELEHVFKAKFSGLGKDTIVRAVSTFKALVAEANFSDDAIEGEFRVKEEAADTLNPTSRPRVGHDQRQSQIPMESITKSINLTFNITLPESQDPAFYERVFAAMGGLRRLVEEGGDPSNIELPHHDSRGPIVLHMSSDDN